MRNMFVTKTAGLAIIFASLNSVTVSLAYDQKQIDNYCSNWKKSDTKLCQQAETQSAEIIDEFRSTAVSSGQKKLLQLCRQESPHSYMMQVTCIERVMARIEQSSDAANDIEKLCENVRINTGGSYRIKEICIEEEMKAAKRLKQ
jgi:hypothetical protein